jgi:transmembrane sensor
MEAMDELILRSLEGTASPEELERLRRWRAESAENDRLYRDMARIWTAVPRGYQPADPAPPPDSRTITDRPDLRVLPMTIARRGPGVRWGMAAAALIVLATGAGITASLYTRRSAEQTLFSADELVTGASDISTVTLRDGSVVRLGPSTHLGVSGRGGDREVTLRGRGFFAVAHNPPRPFRILTPAGKVTVIGTRFDLEAAGDSLSLVVLEGRVVLSTPGREVTVRAGEMVRVVDGTTLPVSAVPDAHRLVTWVGNFLAFQETPLKDAAVEIGSRYGVEIAIADSTLAERAVTAWFADRTLNEVLRILSAATLAEWSIEGSIVTLRPGE